MDTFEYAVMRLYLEVPEVKDKYYRNVKLLITTFDTSEAGCPGGCGRRHLADLHRRDLADVEARLADEHQEAVRSAPR